jgi:hypothetical protein
VHVRAGHKHRELRGEARDDAREDVHGDPFEVGELLEVLGDGADGLVEEGLAGGVGGVVRVAAEFRLRGSGEGGAAVGDVCEGGGGGGP